MSEKQLLTTAYGEIEYETVECESCGEQVVKEDAVRVYVGEYHGKDTWSHKPYDEIKLSSYHWGYLCPYCQEDPAGFPYNSRPFRIVSNWFSQLDQPWQFLVFMSGFLGACTFVVLLMGLVGMLL